jgi:methylenetetrahydrofolate reductase (NADPH)
MAFQGHEIIEEMKLPVHSDQVMIHLNTFHTKADLDNILLSCKNLGIESLLIITGDGSDRLPKLQPKDIDESEVESVTSVELLRYIHRAYPDTFVLGVAFNPYEPPNHEFAKLSRKIEAGASFIITQPIIVQNPQVDRLLAEYPDIPVTVEAWMSKKLSLLSDAIGYKISEDTQFDPIATLKMLHQVYPQCGVYLSLVGFKTQYDLIKGLWI